MLKKAIFVMLVLCTFSIGAQISLSEVEEYGLKDVAISRNGDVAFSYITEIEGLLSTKYATYIKLKSQILGPYDSITALQFTPDNNTLSYVATLNGETRVYVGDEKYSIFESIRSLKILPNDRIAFIGKKGDSYYVYDGRKYFGPYQYARLRVSADKTSVAFSGHEAGDDGHTGIYKDSILLKTTSEAYPEMRYEGKSNKLWYEAGTSLECSLYRDSSYMYGPFGDVYKIKFGPDNMVMVSLRDQSFNYFLVSEKDLQNKSGTQVNNFSYQMAYSYDGTRFSYAIYNGDEDISAKYTLYTHSYKENFTSVSALKYIPSTTILSFRSKNPVGFSFLHVGSEIAGPFNEIYRTAFSRDGSQVAYSVNENNINKIYLGSKVLGLEAEASRLAFSHDGRVLKILAKADDTYFNFVYYDGKVYQGNINNNQIVRLIDHQLVVGF